MMPIVNGYEVIAHLSTMKKRPAVLLDTTLFGEIAADLARAMATARRSVQPRAPEARRIEA
jgi:hypothetical protein